MLYWLISIYLLLAVAAVVLQRWLIYHPTPEYPDAPLESHMLSSGSVQIQLWQANTDAHSAVIYFGGNAEDLRWQTPELKQVLPGHALYLMNYRGYGASGGSADEQSLYQDALETYDYVASRHQHVAVIGRSLGSGIATYLASQRRIDALVLVTPFDELTTIAQRVMPILPMSWLIRDRYPSHSRTFPNPVPTLVIVAGRDQVVPASSSQRLIDTLPPEHTEKLVLEQAGHNNLDQSPHYGQELRRFLDNAQ